MPNREEEQLPDILRALREQGDGLSTPDAAYFEDVAARAMAEARAPARQRSLTGRWLAVAASVLVIMFAGWWALQPAEGRMDATAQATAGQSSEDLLAEVSAEDIDAYISEQIDEFTLELYDEAPLQD